MKKIELILIILICIFCTNVDAQNKTKQQEKTQEQLHFKIISLKHGQKTPANFRAINIVENKDYTVELMIFNSKELSNEKDVPSIDGVLCFVLNDSSALEENPLMIFSTDIHYTDPHGEIFYPAIPLEEFDQIYSNKSIDAISTYLLFFVLNKELSKLQEKLEVK